MGERTIPEHLAHLRTDRRGLPVPYINRWGPERGEAVYLGWEARCGRYAVQYDDTDQTEPDFTAQHFGRQRECMIDGLCQVCARHVPWSRRRLVLSEMSVEMIVLRGQSVPVVTEPWLCERCCDFAVGICPALIRRDRSETLSVVKITSKTQVQMTYSVGYLDGPLEAASRQVEPAMWAKAMILSVTA